MAFSSEYWSANGVRFSAGEVTGAIGDLVTVFPLVIAVAALSDYSLAHLLLGFAVFQIVWGVHYGLPISVEPMKALAALLIGGALTAGELAVAGLLVGLVLLVTGRTGNLGRIEQYVGQPVIRGIQFGVGLLLLETGISLSLDGVSLALLAIGAAAVTILAGYRTASALVVLALGFGYTVTVVGVHPPQIPEVVIRLPNRSALSLAMVEGTVAQLVMTVGNAAVATSVLLSDYYDADVSADELATSMGLMNLVAIPLGAMPMCHGSGGVAGKYAFGARTAGANVILGVIYAVSGLVAVSLVAAFPLPMLGVVLGLIAVELGRAALDTNNLPLTVCIGVVAVVTNVGTAFVAGVLGYLVLDRAA